MPTFWQIRVNKLSIFDWSISDWRDLLDEMAGNRQPWKLYIKGESGYNGDSASGACKSAGQIGQEWCWPSRYIAERTRSNEGIGDSIGAVDCYWRISRQTVSLLWIFTGRYEVDECIEVGKLWDQVFDYSKNTMKRVIEGYTVGIIGVGIGYDSICFDL